MAEATRISRDVEEDLREYARHLVDQAERDGILRPFEEKTSSSAGAPLTEQIFNQSYILGTWRRSPYVPAAFPLALMGSMTSMTIMLGTFDSSGTIWRFTLLQAPGAGADEYLAGLECHEMGQKPLHLTSKLELTSDASQSAEWLIAPCEPFRGDPMDIAISIKSADDGRYLCSNEATKKVALLTLHDADTQDSAGNYKWNIAWECSPDSAATGGDLNFLDKYLTPNASFF